MFFRFRAHNGHGVLLYLEFVQVCVNRTTGEIDQYLGLDDDPALLAEVPSTPRVDKETAKANYLRHLDFKLEWKLDYEQEEESFCLTYEPVRREKQTDIRYIDAMSGEVICERLYR